MSYPILVKEDKSSCYFSDHLTCFSLHKPLLPLNVCQQMTWMECILHYPPYKEQLLTTMHFLKDQTKSGGMERREGGEGGREGGKEGEEGGGREGERGREGGGE